MLKDAKTRKRLEKSNQIIDVGSPNLWGYFKDGVLKTCDEVCGRRGKGGVKEIHGGGMKRAFSRKKAHKAMHWNSTDENKWKHRSMKNKANKAVSKVMREKAEETLTELQNCPNGMLRLVKGLKTDSKEDQGGRCMRGRDGN